MYILLITQFEIILFLSENKFYPLIKHKYVTLWLIKIIKTPKSNAKY
jgi:hypothetical protein